MIHGHHWNASTLRRIQVAVQEFDPQVLTRILAGVRRLVE
jgi:hypothetical protein